MPESLVLHVGEQRLAIDPAEALHIIDLQRFRPVDCEHPRVVGLCAHDGHALPAVWLGDGPLPGMGVVVAFRQGRVVVLGAIGDGEAGEPMLPALEAALG